MRALEGRLFSSGVSYFPTRSTFSDANAQRDSEVFESIYMMLKKHLSLLLPDSRVKNKSIYIMDSTTIQLFQEIFKGSGCSKADGRRKGGLKVHMAVHNGEPVASIVRITQAAYNDVTFAKYVNLPSGSTIIMDRGYRDYRQYNAWTQQQVRWITRMHPHTSFQVLEQTPLQMDIQNKGFQRDERLRLGFPQKRIQKVNCRRIIYTDPKTKKYFEFITNDFISDPSTIADLYKKRWSIELLFKRLKQNMPLQYFLGDNQNAIKIQIWSALIADLLLQVVRSQVKRKWAFSNIASIVRLHLFNYLNLFSFLENPEQAQIRIHPDHTQLKINLSG